MEFQLNSGTFDSTLDEKGRVVIPAFLRDKYSEKIVVTQGVENCVWVLTIPTFENLLKKFKKESKERNLSSEEIEAFYYQHESPARLVEIDPKTGRIPIPVNLRNYAQLTKDCLVVSIKNHLEIWNTELNKAFMDEVRLLNKGIHKKMLGQVNFFSEDDE